MSENKSKILIVDDEKNILKSLKRMLRSEPYTIETANTPLEAIEMVKNTDFDVIISDYRMPELNGREMFCEINKISSDSSKILLSGYSDINIIIEALNREYINKYILKPWNDKNLKLEIKKSIQHRKLIKTNKALHDKIVSQNKELKEINENLESLVLERTKKLVLQNSALRASQAVLNSIPVPIIGIDENFMIVLTNRLSDKLLPHFIPGETITDTELINACTGVMKDNFTTRLKKEEIIRDYDYLIISPVFDKKNIKGCVITFIPNQ